MVVILVVNLLIKFEVWSRFRDIEGLQNFKSRSRDLGHAPFVPIFYNLCEVQFVWYSVQVLWWQLIGRQRIRWNAVHWLKLEVPPKAVLWRRKGPLTLKIWPSNLVFAITCVGLIHVSNFKKTGQKLWSLSWTKRLCGQRDRHKTYTRVILYLSNAMHCIGQKYYIKYNDIINVETVQLT